MEYRDLVAKLCLVLSHVGILFQEAVKRPLQKPTAIASLDQPMTDAARRPIAHALPNHTRDSVGYEGLRRISPGHMGL